MRKITVKDRFWNKVQKTKGCWLWTGSTSSDGYGRFHLDGRLQNAHRVSLLLTGIEIPKGLEVCHSCDNPPCVKPSHLTPQTHSQNVKDALARGLFTLHHPKGKDHYRFGFRKEFCVRGHKRSGKNIYVTEFGKRNCRECWKFYRKKYR